MAARAATAAVEWLAAGSRTTESRTSQRRRSGRTRFVPDAELCLSSRPLQEHHQPPRDPAGEVGAVVVLDDGQGKIGTGADPRTSDEGPVLDEQGVWFHHDVRVVPGRPRAVRPVGRDAAAVQQTEAG
jgi:hypothetical protein